MNFEKAYKELLLGKKIRRKEWETLMHLRLVGKEVKAFKGENIDFYGDSNILVSTGWRVVDGDGTSLSFIEAIEELKLKKAITRDSLEDGFMFVDQGNLTICKPIEYDFMPTFKCLCALDWEILK